MTNLRQYLGRAGETEAARFLEARGYRIVARNVRADRVEIDLIARRGGLLVFVEVKSRRVGSHPSPHTGGQHLGHPKQLQLAQHGHAAEAVDERKQRRLRHGAHAWLAANPIEARGTRHRRFDVVTCLLNDDPAFEIQNETTAPETARWSIQHWEAAF